MIMDVVRVARPLTLVLLPMQEIASLAENYTKRVVEEEGKPLDEIEVANVGKIDAKRRLTTGAEELMAENIVQCLGTMLYTVVF